MRLFAHFNSKHPPLQRWPAKRLDNYRLWLGFGRGKTAEKRCLLERSREADARALAAEWRGKWFGKTVSIPEDVGYWHNARFGRRELELLRDEAYYSYELSRVNYEKLSRSYQHLKRSIDSTKRQLDGLWDEGVLKLRFADPARRSLKLRLKLHRLGQELKRVEPAYVRAKADLQRHRMELVKANEILNLGRRLSGL